jgi:hypothetical protein
MLFGVSAFFVGIAVGAVLVNPTFAMPFAMLPQRINDSSFLKRANNEPGELIIDAEFWMVE